MTKYKLIKEYPGSPKLNTIVEEHKTKKSLFVSKCNFAINHPYYFPEFWEEIVEKDYEIISFKGTLSPRIYTLQPDGNYVCEKYPKFYFTNKDAFVLLKNQGLTINSVKKLSNGKIFTIGDKIVRNNFNENKIRIIESFWVKNDILYVKCNDGSNLLLSEIEHIKQPLFTTEDGVDIFEGDEYHYINSNFINPWGIVNTKADCQTIINKNDLSYKRFSTKEKAEEYILMNKPVLSLSDVWDHLSIKNRKLIIPFVKNKLNQ